MQIIGYNKFIYQMFSLFDKVLYGKEYLSFENLFSGRIYGERQNPINCLCQWVLGQHDYAS